MLLCIFRDTDLIHTLLLFFVLFFGGGVEASSSAKRL